MNFRQKTYICSLQASEEIRKAERGRGVRARLFLAARRLSGKRSGGFSASAAFGRFAPFQKIWNL